MIYVHVFDCLSQMPSNVIVWNAQGFYSNFSLLCFLQPSSVLLHCVIILPSPQQMLVAIQCKMCADAYRYGNGLIVFFSLTYASSTKWLTIPSAQG